MSVTEESDPLAIHRGYYEGLRVLPDGRVLGVLRLMYHWTLHIDLHDTGYEDRYCYQTSAQALAAMNEWDGTGDPGYGWHRHPATNRRRPNGDASKEYIEP